MSSSDAILIGEDWISEHYFTTDARSQSFTAKVAERRKEWDDAADGVGSARSRFTQARAALERTLAALHEQWSDGAGDAAALAAVYADLRGILGYAGSGLVVRREGPVLHVSSPGLTTSPLAIIEASPAAAVEDLLEKDAKNLTVAFDVDDTQQLHSVSRLLSTLFVSDGGPGFVLVLAGQWLLVAEQERWAEGRYLAVNLQLVCERNDTKKGGEIDRALACLCAESLAPDAEGDIWWSAVLADSVKHTVGVSKDLREGVRLSIEIIANDVVTRRRERGLPPLPGDQAQPLAIQSLRFLYRILFLLYAEASPELGVLPVGASEYEQGYGLDRLRELTLVDLATPRSMTGTHLYDSLAVLFRLVDQGVTATPATDDEETASVEGLAFRSLRADLFRPQATAHLDGVRLSNSALQQVLRHLLLSKETRGKDRGFISYAELGINQLGAVYEGLMSYTGFFATEDLYEVAKGGDSSKGSWVVPVERSTGIAAADFVQETAATGERSAVIHRQGTFVFRLAGRDRQQSASYYTPEVLTRFTVGQALEELLDQDGETTPARGILDLTVCEPALGSGAFAIEAVRRLAEQYLRRRQRELRERIDPEDYPRRLQEVKAYLALHQVYGVDLNATAVELAEISLWLDTMTAGLDAPWFGLHLRRGNSLIGARRAVFRRSQLNDKSWLTDVPEDLPLSSLDDEGGLAGRVHHFLLPAEGWGSATEAREAKELAPDALARLKEWRRGTKAKPTKAQADALVDLAQRVDRLWQIALLRLQIAEREIRRSLPVWGADDLPVGGAVGREQIEAALADAAGAYRRLRRVMDAWCALWFWPLTNTLTTVDVDGVPAQVKPPALEQWIDALQMLLGRHAGKRKAAAGQDRLDAGTTWAELDDTESLDLGLASAMPLESVLRKHPWLVVCDRIAAEQGFFHWDLDFAPVFARGGFDLQLGNPPWVRPDTDDVATFAEFDARWGLAGKLSQRSERLLRIETLAMPGAAEYYLDSVASVVAIRSAVSDPACYPHLAGLRPDLYRCFMEQVWRHTSQRGCAGLIHLESHFTDENAGLLRAATYRRLRRHWQFINELKLFEIMNHKRYGVNIYGRSHESISFLNASSIYHPSTVERSLLHDGAGQEPGLKDSDGKWDLRPHRMRIVVVNQDVLASWQAVLGGAETPFDRTPMIYTVNRAAARVLSLLATSPRAAALNLRHSYGWIEPTARSDGQIVQEWGLPESWASVILQGPHLYVGNPFYKTPNATMLNPRDWRENDLESLGSSALPVTSYKPAGAVAAYDSKYTHWVLKVGSVPARDYYRIAWRTMADNTASPRTLMPSIVPPGAGHVDGVFSLGLPETDSVLLVEAAGQFASLLADFAVRVAPKSTIRTGAAARIPAIQNHPLRPELVLRTLRLNCLTDAYARLWQECDVRRDCDAWTGGLEHARRQPLGNVSREWTSESPLRIAADRRQALSEIDALVAIMLGIEFNELATIYRTQFPVLYGFDCNRDHYDANGRLVPHSVITVWRKKSDAINLDERTATNQAGNTYVYELPFVTLDREHDMRVAYAEFERRLAARSGADGSATA